MRLITLNTWGGKVQKPFERFIDKYSKNIDIFCFQEVFDNYQGTAKEFFKVTNTDWNLFKSLSLALGGHSGQFCPVFDDVYGIAIFVNKDISVIEGGSEIIYRNKNFPDPNNLDADHDRKMQWLKIKDRAGRKYVLMNVHGHWVSGDKKDNKARIKQSKQIIDFASRSKLPKVLCGDFNLRPDTKSITMLENKFENLIKRYNVKSTRTSLYTKPEKFADYVFVSPEVKVNKFEVLKEEVSDHFPLFLEFE
jgi:endonuclease/exonuclease/phosphatase family metal-dependent hydrolase